MFRHAFDALSFVFGVIFLIAGVTLLGGRPSADALEWVGPITAIGLGLVILLATVPRRGGRAEAAAAGEAAAADGPVDAGRPEPQ